MAQITLGGKPINTAGDVPIVGQMVPGFAVTKTDLSTLTNDDLVGQKVVLNIFPSVDTAVCAKSVRAFNEQAGGRDNTIVLCVSADLPFAQGRFCGAEGLDNVTPVSTFRTPGFGESFGVTLVDGPLHGLLARAVVVVDETGHVVHSELVPEIAQEPDYAAALAAL